MRRTKVRKPTNTNNIRYGVELTHFLEHVKNGYFNNTLNYLQDKELKKIIKIVKALKGKYSPEPIRTLLMLPVYMSLPLGWKEEWIKDIDVNQPIESSIRFIKRKLKTSGVNKLHKKLQDIDDLKPLKAILCTIFATFDNPLAIYHFYETQPNILKHFPQDDKHLQFVKKNFLLILNTFSDMYPTKRFIPPTKHSISVEQISDALSIYITLAPSKDATDTFLEFIKDNVPFLTEDIQEIWQTKEKEIFKMFWKKFIASIPLSILTTNAYDNRKRIIKEIPFGVYQPDVMDIDKIREHLDSTHAGMEDVKDSIMAYLANMIDEAKREGYPYLRQKKFLLFIGPPGMGKTSLSKSIADALGRPLHLVSLSSINDPESINGFGNTYKDSRPGMIVETWINDGRVNSVIVLDEIEKIKQSRQSSVLQGWLLSVLDPDGKHEYKDNFLGTHYNLDISPILFIATANKVEDINPYILDRAYIVNIGKYTPKELREIARTYANKQGKSIDDDASDLLITILQKTGKLSVRSIQEAINTIATDHITKKDIGNWFILNIKNSLVVSTDYTNTSDAIGKASIIGVRTGDSINFVQVSTLWIVEDDGNNVLANAIEKLVRIAYETTKSVIKITTGTTQNLDKFSVSLVPISQMVGGSSMMLSMFAAMYSILFGIKVPGTWAFTGELDVKGNVMEVGMLPHKIMGAAYAGMKKIFIPASFPDEILDILKDELGNTIEIIKVSHVSEIIDALTKYSST